MAEILRYVDTDVVGGLGNGTSWANAYSTLNAWETGQQSDLDTANNWMHCYARASAGTADSTAVTIEGWITSLTDNILIETASTDRASASGISVSKYRMTNDIATILTISEDYVQIDGLQIPNTRNSIAGSRVAISGISVNNKIILSNCYIYNSTGTGRGVYVNDANLFANVLIWNLIISGANNGIYVNNCATCNIYNSDIYNCANNGILRTLGTAAATNCAVFKNLDDFNGTITINYCASDDNDGTNNVAESSSDANWISDFLAAATGDFRLLRTSSLFGAGLNDPGSGLFLDDIEGTTRIRWDVGPYECPAVGIVSATLTGKIADMSFTGKIGDISLVGK